MNKPSRTWIVKDKEGRIFGPFLTERILKQIERGYFSGGELVALYPGGSWIPISKAPEFYDKLLDVLANEGMAGRRAPSGSFANEAADQAEGNDGGPQAGDEVKFRGRVVRESDEEQAEKESSPTQVEKVNPPGRDAPVIELSNLQKLQKTERKKIARLPLFLILSAIVLVVAALLLTPEKKQGRMRLLAPRKGMPEVSKQETERRLQRGLGFFQSDTYSGYVQAQTAFVEMTEGASNHPVAYASLCMVYRELWPFTAQDSENLRVFSQVAQDAKRLDPAGFAGATCEIMYLNAANRVREARGLTDLWITTQSSAAILYDLTAEFLMNEQKWREAAGYAEKAAVLWSQWLKPYVVEARNRARVREFPEALRLYREVLKAQPNHQVARIELALIELNQFNQIDKSFEMLRTAIDSGEPLPLEAELSASFALAQIYEKRNNKREAKKLAARAYALAPNDQAIRELLLRLGVADDLKSTGAGSRELLFRGDQYARIGDCVAAQAEYRAAFDVDPSNAMAAMKAAKCLWQLNQSNDAIDWLKKAIVADPKMVEAYILLADYFSQRFDYLSAINTLQKIQQIAPKNFEVARGFAQVELRRNNFQGTISFSRRALELYEADPETYLIMAEAHMGMAQFPDAQRFAQRAIELDQTRVSAQSLYVRILLDLQGIDSALTYVDSLINTYQHIVDYRVTKGEVLLREERYEAAIQVLAEARSLEKSNKKALLLMGQAYKGLGQNTEALRSFLEAAEMDPSDAHPLYRAGLLYSQEERTLKDAARQFQRVLKINPRFPLAHVQLGYVYLKQGLLKEALEEANSERANNPELPDSYVLAAEVHYAMKQYSSCAGEYQKAVSRRVTESSIYVKMARCYRLSGAIDSALSLLNQAKAQESGNPDIYKELGAAYQVRSMGNEALDAYSQYLALAPNAIDRKDVEALMRRIQAGDFGAETRE